jgi:glycerophosphoryl diester phosphodiesterase
MESIFDWGVNIIFYLQRFSPTLDAPFKALTFLGDETFFLLLLPFMYWCVDRKRGLRLGLLFLFSAWVNFAAKELAAQPRPFEYDTRVKKLVHAGGGGFPSGHTQGAITVWGYLATRFRSTWFRILAVLLILLVPLSRLYLGVHFPQDLAGGYVIGGVLLILFIVYEERAAIWLNAKGLGWKLALSLVVPGIMLFVFPGDDPGGVTTASVLMGLAMGASLEQHWVGFDTAGPVWKRLVRLVPGLIILVVLYVGLKLAFNGLEPERLFRFVRYFLVGLWCGGGGPWAFRVLGLASRRSEAE